MKATKRLIAMLLVAVIMVAGVFAVPAFASELEETSIGARAGTENWGSATKQHVGTFTFKNNNLTPVKTITQSGYLYLHVNYSKADSYDGDVMLTVQIRSANGTQLTNDYFYSYGRDEMTAWVHVSAGDQIQIFFDASTTTGPSAHYRSANVTYYYTLIAD